MIRDRNGHNCLYSRPNPLLTEQNRWNEYILHNCQWTYIIHEDKKIVKEEKRIAALPKEVKPHTIQVWCLPARVILKKDDFYQEDHRQIVYGDKFLFEALLAEQGDFAIKIWTTVQNISEDSILYPQTQDKRWWRVVKVETIGKGFVITGLPSDYSPEFAS